MGLNFTAIVAFAIIMLSFEFSGLLLARRRITSILGNLASFVILVVALVGITVWVAGDSMTEFIVKNLTFQTDLALGAASDDKSYGALVGRYVASYYDHVLIEPLSLLIGDGFTTWGLPKGGDIGFVETLARFGVPYFLLLLFCLVKLLGVAVLRIRAISREAPAEERELDHGSALQFAASVILLVLITEGHYTVWTAKAVLPVVFFSVALYGRYASAPRRGASLRVGAAMTVAGHLENEPWPASQV
jgi:hypothetical protein